MDGDGGRAASGSKSVGLGVGVQVEEGTKNAAASPYRLGQHSHTAFGGSVERHYFSSTEDVLARAVLAVLAVKRRRASCHYRLQLL